MAPSCEALAIMISPMVAPMMPPSPDASLQQLHNHMVLVLREGDCYDTLYVPSWLRYTVLNPAIKLETTEPVPASENKPKQPDTSSKDEDWALIPENSDDDEGSDNTLPKEIVYDTNGDTVLVVGPVEHRFQFLLEDDPKSTAIFLDIVHHRYSALPLFFTFQELYSLAQLSHKYELRDLFNAHAARWVQPFIKEELKQIFESWLEHICGNSEKDKEGNLVYFGRKVRDWLPPAKRDEFEALVQKYRLALLSALIEVCTRGVNDGYCYRFKYKEEYSSDFGEDEQTEKVDNNG
ncbi:hypothetical protein AJ80_06638 [Polytolypa hystricis UAMH7299]|uniref:Uncharacterized protein n=1 Tax=Polytolypa hystricis (strain UAMH7299) TaxID=1447883 RepID=A0A2B7XVN8_POLH7|nr:hypothetical protein AJ80_06638 [Polytolypa hystricis UAMH7299]